MQLALLKRIGRHPPLEHIYALLPWSKPKKMDEETFMNTHHPKSRASFGGRSESGGKSKWPRADKAQRAFKMRNRKFTRSGYLALAQAEVLAGDIVGAEHYYQHPPNIISDRCHRIQERHRKRSSRHQLAVRAGRRNACTASTSLKQK